jgi:hypothetical protein
LFNLRGGLIGGLKGNPEIYKKKFGWYSFFLGLSIIYLIYAWPNIIDNYNKGFESALKEDKNKIQDKITQEEHRRKQEMEDYIKNISIEKNKGIIDRYGYWHINVRVKNNGNKTIEYIKIKAVIADKNNKFIDTFYTNSIDKIYPGLSKELEFSHMSQKDHDKYAIVIEEVKTNP